MGGKSVPESSAARIWVCRTSNSSTSGNEGRVTEKLTQLQKSESSVCEL